MNANPMTGQVGKLVGNLLAGGGAVFLPGVGSLYVERRGARRIDRRHVAPPCRTVLFTSQQRGPSLVEEIARVLRVNGVQPENPLPEAQQVYDRWIAAVQTDGTLTVEGVGTLRFKDFKLDEAFDRRLNPQGHAPVRVRAPRRFDAVLWIGIAAIVCVLGGTAYWWFEDRVRGVAPESGAVAAESPLLRGGTDSVAGIPDGEIPVAEPSATDRNVNPSETSGSGKSSESGETAGTASHTRPAVRNGASFEPSRMVSGRHYVVLGVFSTVENAERAARDAASKDVAIACGIYRFGAKFMVSPFESDDREACRLFAAAHEERFPNMWTYTAR